MLVLAATAIVARRTGEKDLPGASKASGQAITLALGVAVLLSALGAIYAGDILALMGASDAVLAVGTGFARLMLGNCAPILLLFILNGIFRGAGDATMAMRSLWLASGSNIVLCPIFIHWWGLEGAALATICGRTLGVVYQTWQLWRGGTEVRLKLSDLLPIAAVQRAIVAIAWPATLQFLIGSGSWILLTRLVAAGGGTAASAGYQIAFRNFVFFILPAFGLSNAAATLVGQNLGAKDPDRPALAVRTTAMYAVALMAIVTLVLTIGAGPIIDFYTDDGEVARYGRQALRIIACGYVFYGYGMVMTQALNGAGDTKGPTWINVVCFWLFQTPLAYALVRSFGAQGAIIAIPVGHGLLAVLAYRYFRRGHWQKVQI